jgi:chromosome segregation ATPase
MPSKKETANQMLHDWKPWDKIKEMAGEGSGTYEELRLFLDTIGRQTYNDLRTQNTELNQLKSQVEKTTIALQRLESEQGRLEIHIEAKKKEHTQLVSMNNDLKQLNQTLESKNNELVEKGVDDEIIKMIRSFDHKDKPELVQRIENMIKYTQLLEEIETRQGFLDTVTNEIERNRSEQTRLEENISSLREETKKRENGFERVGNIADIAELAVTYGYSPVAFESLLKTIEGYFEITPYTTNTRVFEALQEYQNLQQIKEATIKANRENEVVKNELFKTKGELEAIKNQTLETLQVIARESLNKIEVQKREAEKKLGQLDDQQVNTLALSEKRIQSHWDNLEQKNKIWEEKLKEIGKYETLLKHSILVSTAYYNPEYAKNIGTHDIVLLAQVVNYWVQYHMKGAVAVPPIEVAKMQGLALGTFSVPGLSKFLALELIRRAQS